MHHEERASNDPTNVIGRKCWNAPSTTDYHTYQPPGINQPIFQTKHIREDCLKRGSWLDSYQWCAGYDNAMVPCTWEIRETQRAGLHLEDSDCPIDEYGNSNPDNPNQPYPDDGPQGMCNDLCTLGKLYNTPAFTDTPVRGHPGGGSMAMYFDCAGFTRMANQIPLEYRNVDSDARRRVWTGANRICPRDSFGMTAHDAAKAADRAGGPDNDDRKGYWHWAGPEAEDGLPDMSYFDIEGAAWPIADPSNEDRGGYLSDFVFSGAQKGFSWDTHKGKTCDQPSESGVPPKSNPWNGEGEHRGGQHGKEDCMRLHGTNLIRDGSNNYVSNHYSAGNGDCDTKNAGKYNGDTILGMCLHFTLRPRTHGCAIFPVGYGTYYLYHTHHLDNGNIRGTIIQSPQPPSPPPPPRRSSGVFGGGGGGGGGRRLSEQQLNVTFADHYLEPTRYVWRCSYNMGDATIPEYYKHPYKDLVRNPEWQKGLNYSELWILPHQHPENLLADTLAYQRTQHHERTRVLAQQMKQRQQPGEYAREHVEHEDILEIRSKNTEHREATRRFLEARKQTPQNPRSNPRSKRRAHDDFARFSTSPGDVRGSEIQPTQMAMFVLDLDATGTHDLVIHSPAPSDGSCSMRYVSPPTRLTRGGGVVSLTPSPLFKTGAISKGGLATIRLRSTPKTPTGRSSPRRCATAGMTAAPPPVTTID